MIALENAVLRATRTPGSQIATTILSNELEQVANFGICDVLMAGADDLLPGRQYQRLHGQLRKDR